jgi:hypothetical protein
VCWEYSPKKVRTQVFLSWWKRGNHRSVDYREIGALAARISLLAAKLNLMRFNNSCVRAARCVFLQGAGVGEWWETYF